MSIRYNEAKPIYVGLHGKAGSGKTVTAKALAPGYQISEKDGFNWNYAAFSTPLYEMVTIRRSIEGENAKDRILYSLHEILLELFGKNPLYGAPRFDILHHLTHQIATMELPLDESIKPRTFLQTVGSLCREVKDDCFINYLFEKATELERNHYSAVLWDLEPEVREDYNLIPFIHIIEDIRLPNEAKAILDRANGIVIELETSSEIRRKRLEERDGYVSMSETEAQHVSEAGIPKDLITVTLNTDELTVEEQVSQVKELIYKTLEINYATHH